MNLQSTITLNNGTKMPVLGLGVFRASNDGEAGQAVRWALEIGYRHIDTAAAYGNEESVGKAIRESGVPREQIFLTTKLWNDDSRRGTQAQAFEQSLDRLGLDYVDLYLIHWPVPGKYAESWQVLEKIYAGGRAKAVGVSNFHEHHLKDIKSATGIVPAANQVECHPLLSQEPLRAYCASKGIAVTAWSPLGGQAQNLSADPLLTKIGKEYGKSAAQVVLRWEVQHGLITIPKSVHQQRIRENSEIFDFELSSQDMAKIDAMNRNSRSGSDPDNFNF